jgi:TPR repeat protein
MLKRLTTLSLALLIAACATPTPNESEYNLGVAAYKAKDYASARTHWSRSIESGDPASQNNLAYLLYYGLGGAAEMNRAVALWSASATNGHSEAQWHLGHAYEDGKAVPANLVEAYAWYRCAIASAERSAADDEAEGQIAEDARKSLTSLLERLPPEQFSASEELARKYVGSYARKARV